MDAIRYGLSGTICPWCKTILYPGDWHICPTELETLRKQLEVALEVAIKALKEYAKPDEDEYNTGIAYDALAEIERIGKEGE